jgi:broad specificity phosphatase PhoE
MPLHGGETQQRRLMIMRHAKSAWKAHVLTDHARPLNKRGRRDALRVGKRHASLFVPASHLPGASTSPPPFRDGRSDAGGPS